MDPCWTIASGSTDLTLASVRMPATCASSASAAYPFKAALPTAASYTRVTLMP